MSDTPAVPPEKRVVKFKQSKKRGRAEIERDKIDIARLYLEQKTQLQISEWIGANRPYNLSVPMVCITLKGIFEDWKIQAVNKIDELKARDLAKLLDVEKTATEAWQNSIGIFEKTTREHLEVPIDDKHYGRKKKPKKEMMRVNVVTEKLNGDPRFLEVILKCIAQRAEILGYRPNRKLEEGGEAPSVTVSVEVQTALQIAYGGNSGQSTGQPGTTTLVNVRTQGGGEWSPPGSIPKLCEGATDIESQAT